MRWVARFLLGFIVMIGLTDRFAPSEFMTNSGVLLHRWVEGQAKAYDDGLLEWRVGYGPNNGIPKIVHGAVANVFLQVLNGYFLLSRDLSRMPSSLAQEYVISPRVNLLPPILFFGLVGGLVWLSMPLRSSR